MARCARNPSVWTAVAGGQRVGVLSIQSQVVYGHVGNSAAVLPLQRQGFEVWPVPTAILSHHPGHGKPAGRLLTPQDLQALIDSLAAQGLLGRCQGVLTGWLGSPELAAIALATVGRVRALNPAAIWLCDPVIGDQPGGIYVHEGMPAFFRDQATPQTDVLTPNQFELEQLTGRSVRTRGDAIAAAESLRARGARMVVVTSLNETDSDAREIEVLAVSAEGAWLGTTPALDRPPHGAGDMFAALLLARLLKGKTLKKALAFAMAATYGVLKASVRADSREPLLAEAQEELVHPAFDQVVLRIR